MGDTVTRCPSCATSFRVSEAQLNIAGGRVRCGKCMHVFSALEHGVAPTPLTSEPVSAPDQKEELGSKPKPELGLEHERELEPETEPEPEPEPESEPESEPEAEPESEPESESEPRSESEPGPEPERPSPASDSAAEPVPARPASTFSIFPPDEGEEDPWYGIGEEPVELVQAELEQESEQADSADAALADDEFSDFELDDVESVDFNLDDGERSGGEADAPVDQLDEAALDDEDLLFDDLGPRREKDVVAEEALRREALQNSEFDESFFDSLNDTELEEDEETRLALPPLRPQHERANVDPDADTVLWNVAPAAPKARDQDSDTRWALEMIDGLHAGQDETVAAARSINDDFAFDDATQLDSFNVSGDIDRQFDSLGGFADDYGQPDDYYAGDFDDARRGGWFWVVGSVLLALLLAGQYVVFNFDKLATDERFRPALERVCASLACELPVLEDLNKISSEKLVVRSHPDKSDALMVDVIITNRAKFAQPFPALELTFSDLRGKVVATQSFYPSEYLHGELRGMTLMPSKSPIHLELDIDDPGTAAINYKLTLVKGYD